MHTIKTHILSSGGWLAVTVMFLACTPSSLLNEGDDTAANSTSTSDGPEAENCLSRTRVTTDAPLSSQDRAEWIRCAAADDKANPQMPRNLIWERDDLTFDPFIRDLESRRGPSVDSIWRTAPKV